MGAGINGFSCNFFKRIKVEVDYTAVESVGQLVDLMNYFFEKNKLNAKAFHLSLFEKYKIKKIIEKQKRPRIVFMFKIIDALEKIKTDYSKELILEIAPLVDKFVLSFSTKSFGGKKFFANRNWILDFIKNNFDIVEDFEINGERYIIFKIFHLKSLNSIFFFFI